MEIEVPTDLTRFDFHAMRFMESEDVSAMSAEEVGCYLLLLIKSWLIAKDATLPDDLEGLARIGRVERVSDRVLKKFPIVETSYGQRRQNPTLYGEWVMAKKRSDDGRKAVESRRDRQSITDDVRPYNDRTTYLPTSVLPKPSQAVPNQTNPSQEFTGQCSFKNIAIHYSSFFGISHSHAKKHVEKYQVACSKFGEDQVLKYFDRWAPSAGWLKERRDPNGLNLFWKPLEEMIAGDDLAAEREQAVQKVNEVDIDIVSDIEKSLAKEREEIAAKIKQQQEEDERAKETAYVL